MMRGYKTLFKTIKRKLLDRIISARYSHDAGIVASVKFTYNG
jgi:hypothetical protein